MQIIKLIQAKNVLAPVFQEKLSPKLSYKLMKFLNKINVEERFYGEKMREIIAQYCEKDNDGKYIQTDVGLQIKNGCIDECNQAISELDLTEVDVPDIAFTIDELSEIKLSVNDMMALSPFITEE